jgi:hypothetical protein
LSNCLKKSPNFSSKRVFFSLKIKIVLKEHRKDKEMRLIEKRILTAWHSKRTCKLSERDMIFVTTEGLRTYYLWGTPLLVEDEAALYIYHGGYHTRLTASRLNALQSIHNAGHCTLYHGSLYLGADLFDGTVVIPKKPSTKEQELFT